MQCHMPPTSVSRGSVPEATTRSTSSSRRWPWRLPDPGEDRFCGGYGFSQRHYHHHQHRDVGQHAVLGLQHLPQRHNGVLATPRPIATATATPNPTASPLRVTVTIDQVANQSSWGNFSGGDRAVWMQDTIEQRQAWTKAKIATIWDTLEQAAVNGGFADIDEAHTDLVAIPAAERTTSQTALPHGLHERRVRGDRGQLRSPQLGLLRRHRQHGHEPGEAGTAPGRRKWIVSRPQGSPSPRSRHRQKVIFRGRRQDRRGIAAAGKVKLQRRGSEWRLEGMEDADAQPRPATTRSGQKLTKKGKFKFRAVMPGDGGLNLTSNRRNW